MESWENPMNKGPKHSGAFVGKLIMLLFMLIILYEFVKITDVGNWNQIHAAGEAFNEMCEDGFNAIDRALGWEEEYD